MLEFTCRPETNFQACKAALKNCTYLEDRMVDVEGYKIYGLPYQPTYYGWGFNREDNERAKLFGQIPKETDIVMCHGPPYKILDKCVDGYLAGCNYFRHEMLNRVKPLIVAFGHIHEDHGMKKVGSTMFVNSANCTVRYQLKQPPEIIDLPRK